MPGGRKLFATYAKSREEREIASHAAWLRRTVPRGVWLRLRHVQGFEIWVGTAHFPPGCTQPQHAKEVHDHLAGLPPTTLPILLACDLNADVGWGFDECCCRAKLMTSWVSAAGQDFMLYLHSMRTLGRPLAGPDKHIDRASNSTASAQGLRVLVGSIATLIWP